MLDLSSLYSVDEGSMLLLNHFRKKFRGGFPFSINDSISGDVKISKEINLSESSNLVAIILDTEFGMISVTLEVGFVDWLSDLYFPSWTSKGSSLVPFPWRAVVCLERLYNQSPLAGIEASVLNVFAPNIPPRGPDTIYSTVFCEGREFKAAISLFNVNPDVFTDAFGPLESEQTEVSENITFCTDVELLVAGPALQENGDISVGDILILNGNSADELHIRLRPPGSAFWTGNLKQDGQFNLTEIGG